MRYFYVKCLGDRSYLKHAYGKGSNRGDVFTMDKSEAVKLTRQEAYRLGYAEGDPIYILVPCGEDGKAPFGAVAFDPDRHGDSPKPTNGERAAIGRDIVALYYLLSNGETGAEALREWARTIDLSEEPEVEITELLTDLMHYCHRDGIELYGKGNPLADAQQHFNVESGGASL